MSLYRHLFYTEFTENLCAAQSMIDFMMATELALAKAQEVHSIIPGGTANQLELIFQELEIDIEKLQKAIPLSGNATPPLLKQIIPAVKLKNEAIAEYIHLGATSQDIVDTATVLKLKAYLTWLFEKLKLIERALIALTKRYRQTIMIGRTLMQQARPITLGLKTAQWLKGVHAAKLHLQSTTNNLLRIQLGGAVGSQNQFLTKEVRQSFAELLNLKDALPWHTQRTDIAAFASALGLLSGSIGKIAQDIVLLSQTEVAEVFEPTAEGRGISSTMPHKRNPVLSTAILANVHRIPFLVSSILAAIPQTHERAAGAWHSEWETLDDIIGLTAGAVEKSIEVLDGLEVDENRMLHNLEITKGLVYAETVSLALAGKIGKQAAHESIKEACKKAKLNKQHLREVIAESFTNFSDQELNDLFSPKNAIGRSLEIIDEILAQHEDAL